MNKFKIQYRTMMRYSGKTNAFGTYYRPIPWFFRSVLSGLIAESRGTKLYDPLVSLFCRLEKVLH